MNILGISAYYHDSAACLLREGEIIAAAQEERFSRRKGDERFPNNAILYCLKKGEIELCSIDHIVFYDDPKLKFDRMIKTYLAFSPKGIRSFAKSMSVWLGGKLNIEKILHEEFSQLTGLDRTQVPPISIVKHHLSHASSAFFPSPFKEAAVLCLDGVGEWTTTSVWLGLGSMLIPQWEIEFPHSLGLLYSAFTHYTGFKVNSGEYKVMGLAPYGAPKYVRTILENLIDLKEDGTFRLDMKYFDYPVGFSMINEKFAQLFGGPSRQGETLLTQRDMDLARSIQDVTEEVILRLARTINRETGQNYLCIAGGVGLNCVANGRILREGPFKDIWIQPAAGDAGGSVGAALAFWHGRLKRNRRVNKWDAMKGSFLGPEFSNDEIRSFLDLKNVKYTYMDDNKLIPILAAILAQGNVVGWFQGRMEFGPRALGARSILGDPRNPQMQQNINLKIKFRESFRPFAPSVLAERVGDYFKLDRPSPYMSIVALVKDELLVPMTDDQKKLFGIDKLNIVRSEIPAVTHVDYSSRVQTVHKSTNPRYYHLLEEFEKTTGCGLLINTSFNVRGEPIVCTPEEAYRCFMRTGMDILVMENFILSKHEQVGFNEDEGLHSKFRLD